MPKSPRQTGYRVEALGKQHDRREFSCGVETLDRYLKEQAGQDARKRVAAPFVLCNGNSNTILGYYTLSSLSIEIGTWPENIARKLPRYPVVPATLLGRLAVDARVRGQGMGELLLVDALLRALDASRKVASFAVVVDAKDNAVAVFYGQYGFTPFIEFSNRLFLAMRVIERSFA